MKNVVLNTEVAKKPTKLDQDDIDTIVQAFQHNVIKVGKTEVILKAAKYGFEIYYNNADER
jgi:hypothetical protein